MTADEKIPEPTELREDGMVQRERWEEIRRLAGVR
jgi:hypothetical protein